MDNIKVSIITVCYNAEKTIRRTIESVLGQTYNNIEYIIVDGQSSDNTVAIIKEYAGSNSNIIWISEADKGIYDAMNKGISMASGDLIGIINSDDWYETDAVDSVLKQYDKTPYQILYGILRTYNSDEVVEVSWKSHKALRNGMIGHPACFVSRKLYLEKGMYSTEYRYVSDYEFMLKMSNDEDVTFKPVFSIIANFSTGGACSTGKAWMELTDLQHRWDIITNREYRKRILTDRLYHLYRSVFKEKSN